MGPTFHALGGVAPSGQSTPMQRLGDRRRTPLPPNLRNPSNWKTFLKHSTISKAPQATTDPSAKSCESSPCGFDVLDIKLISDCTAAAPPHRGSVMDFKSL